MSTPTADSRRGRAVEHLVATTTGAFVGGALIVQDLRAEVVIAIAIGVTLTVSVLRRERKTGLPDERQRAIERASLCFAAQAMFLAATVSYIIARTNGMDARPLLWVLGAGSLTYLGSRAWAHRFS